MKKIITKLIKNKVNMIRSFQFLDITMFNKKNVHLYLEEIKL